MTRGEKISKPKPIDRYRQSGFRVRLNLGSRVLLAIRQQRQQRARWVVHTGHNTVVGLEWLTDRQTDRQTDRRTEEVPTHLR